MSQIGQQIRLARHASGLTQEGLARRADISVGTLIRIEMGHHRPTLSTLGKIAAALEVSIGDLADDPAA